jgi:hypothetical protein
MKKITEMISGEIISNRSTLAWFILSVISGSLIWGLSQAIVGQREPWDDPLGVLYYNSSMLGFGFIFGAIRPRLFWLVPIGIFAGQLLVIKMRSVVGADFFPLIGLISLIAYSMFSLMGAIFGAVLRVGVRYALRRRNRGKGA